MTGAQMLTTAAQYRQLAEQSLAEVASFKGVFRVPLWVSLLPAASWYALSRSLSAETRMYLAREELERRLRGYVRDLQEIERQAAALGEAAGNPAPLLELGNALTLDCGAVVELGQFVTTAERDTNGQLARLVDLPAKPLEALNRAGFLITWGPVLLAVVAVVVLVYIWRTGSLAAGAKKAAAKAAEVVT